MHKHTVKVVHRDWTGKLKLNPADHTVERPRKKGSGRYWMDGDRLGIEWKDLRQDIFVMKGPGVFVLETFKPIHLSSLDVVKIHHSLFNVSRIAVDVADGAYEVSLRVGTTDIPTFSQVFIDKEYDSDSLPDKAEVIVDLGAHVGYATVFFGLKYPNAKILAVEPEEANFKALEGNVAALGDRIFKERAAVWSRDGEISLHTLDDIGATLGGSGAKTSEQGSETSKLTPCWKLATLCQKYGFDKVDILKIDIVGSELELFLHEPEPWLTKTALIIVDAHERLRPGTGDALRKILAGKFEELPPSGQNLVFRRMT